MGQISGQFVVNGVNAGVQHVRELQEGVTLEQVQKAIDGDGFDSLIYEQNGKAYIAYGDALDLSSLKNITPGDKTLATLNGEKVNLVLFENEVNSASEGLDRAWEYGKKIGIGAGKFVGNNGLEILGAGMTLGAFARMGGAKVASTAGQSILSKMGTWAFGPAKDLTLQAGKGFGKMAKWGAIALGVGAVVGTGASVIHGAARGTNTAGIDSITVAPKAK